MSLSLPKVVLGRENWKKKAIDRGIEKCYEKKEKLRIKRERDEYKSENSKLRKELKREEKRPAVIVKKADLIYIALQLFLIARIGFRAVSRVLGVFFEHLGMENPPCPQTIINWVMRFSMVKIQNASQLISQKKIPGDLFCNGFIWMIDASIGLGSGKILAILAIDANHYASGKMPSLKDTHCIAVSVSNSWTGELIAEFLKKVIAISGRPAAYLKDGGTDLGKATRLLDEEGLPSLVIDDISHVIANLFKHKYENDRFFCDFISTCGKVSKKLKQTILACLAPPKISMKARFMNFHRLVQWANKILRHSTVGRSPKNSLLSKLRESFDHLPEYKRFISKFLAEASPLLECQKILKNKGLTLSTLKECQEFIEQIPSSSSIRQGFTNWANKQLEVAAKLNLNGIGLPITSDSIESLFGAGKRHGTGDIKDAYRIALRLPALTGELTKENAAEVLLIGVKEQNELTKNIPSLTKQRRKILNSPGTIETLKSDNKSSTFEFISESKNREKKPSKVDVLYDLNKTSGSVNASEKRGVFREYPISTA
jgi:hypothetical protein